MKTKSILKSVFTGTAILAFATLISSCKKDDIDDSGSANLRIVNASQSSPGQGFYLAGKTIVEGGLSYGDETDYIATNSGNNLEAEFRSDGSSTAFATDRFDLDNGGSYTVFLAGEGQAARVQHYKDDLTPPANEQARVRFIHLSDGAPANIDIRNASGANLATNLEHDASTNYLDVAPGILSLQVFAAGESTSLGNFNLAAFAAGKIYTVYITGSTANTISVQQLTQN